MDSTDIGETDPGELVEFIDELSAMATANENQPVALAAGTFVLYPMVDGGVMFVTSVEGGPMAGIKHTRIPPGMIRAVSVLAGGGTRRSALRALLGRGNRKEITS